MILKTYALFNLFVIYLNRPHLIRPRNTIGIPYRIWTPLDAFGTFIRGSKIVQEL